MPVTRVQEHEQSYQDSHNDAWTKALNDDTKESKDMPVCVQVIGYSFEDEKVLGLMNKIDQ